MIASLSMQGSLAKVPKAQNKWQPTTNHYVASTKCPQACNKQCLTVICTRAYHKNILNQYTQWLQDTLAHNRTSFTNEKSKELTQQAPELQNSESCSVRPALEQKIMCYSHGRPSQPAR